MFLDADDWVDARLVETSRAVIDKRHAAGVVDGGFAIALRGLRAVRLPNPDVFDGELHRVCRSSVVHQVEPEYPDPRRRDPYPILHDHHRCLADAHEHGLEVARIPVDGAYLIDTYVNHSELHGPFVSWRQRFTEAVRRVGAPLDDGVAAHFGLDLQRIRDVSRRCGGPR